MTVVGLERALGMLLLDAAFCERFFLNPSSAMREAGLPLSPIEVDALSRMSRVAWPGRAERDMPGVFGFSADHLGPTLRRRTWRRRRFARS
jgi:hypothetical protein